MTRKVAVVPHTHWDREWYAGFPYFRLRLIEVMDQLLDRLERDPAHRFFLLDGQMAMVDDYLEVRPEAAARMRELVRTGRLSVGPWYVLMDEFLVSGETIVRNLQLGVARAAGLGGHLPVGYLPDMFGHIGQMPQILREAGFAHAVVWRGVPRAVDRTAFWWRAPDGSTVRAEYLPAGYSNGASIPDDPDALLRRLRAHEAQLSPFLGEDAPLLFMNGTDHQAPQPWLPAVAGALNDEQKDFELRITPLEEYLATAPTEALPSWVGELRSSARANLLMGVASNRVDVKVAAARAERGLERLAEPLAALWLPAGAWPQEQLDLAWLEVIRNSAHDSICACSADEVGVAVLHRYADAATIASGVVEQVQRELRRAFGRRGPVVVNPGPRTRSGLVELVLPGADAPTGMQLVDRVTAGSVEREARGRDLARVLAELTETGWLEDGRATAATVEWTPTGVRLDLVADRAEAADASLRPVGSAMAEAAAQAAANPERPLWVRVDRPASVRVLARAVDVPGYGWASLPVGGAGPLPGLGWRPAEPVPAGGTTPDGSVRGGDNWLDNGLIHVAVNPADGTFAVNGLAGMDRLVDGGDDGDTYNYSPPAEDLVVERPDSVTSSLCEDGPLRGRLRVERVFTWPERVERGRRVGSARVAVTTILEVRAGERLVRITTRFDNPARDHRLRALFPLAERAGRSEAECAFGVATRPLVAEGGEGEAGIPTFPSRRWVRAGGVTLTHEGLAEYEVVDDGWQLALTLLRSTGLISRPAPALRPNSAGPPLTTRDTQMVGPVEARYGVATGAVDPWALADDAWLPLLVVAAAGGGTLPPTGSHLRVTGAQVSSLRRASGALELRVFNPSDDPAVVSVEGRAGWLVDLLGRPTERWRESFALRPWGLATARVDEPDGVPVEH